MIKTLSRSSLHHRLRYDTQELWYNLVSPLCGIATSIFAFVRQTYDPHVLAMSSRLTNAALSKGISEDIVYHISGISLNRDEAMLKCLAETYERYIAIMFEVEKRFPTYFGSYQELLNKFPDDIIPPPQFFHYFSSEQDTSHSSFSHFTLQMPLMWVKLVEITLPHKLIWLPAQLISLGYLPKFRRGERRINSAVSTGTAVHTDQLSCLWHSWSEMILIDAAIGHWYTQHKAYRIVLDHRTRHIQSILQKSIPYQNLPIEFYWIPSADFSLFTVACLARHHKPPAFSIGLGVDYNLEAAMHKAYLEFVGTRWLANTLVVLKNKGIKPEAIRNLDDNVAYYASGEGSAVLNARFNVNQYLPAADLPADFAQNKQQAMRAILNSCQQTQKNVGFINLTTNEATQLGLVATKLWSPQLLTVPLPSFAPANHPRFCIYGGVTHHAPHPYP